MSAPADDAAEDDSPDRVQLLRFRVGDQIYAVETGVVAGIVDPPDPTRVPDAPPAVAGATRVRGETSVVFNLHTLLDEPVPSERPDRRAVVFDRDADTTPVVFDVDAVLGMTVYHVDRVHAAADAGADERLFAAVVNADEGPLPVLGVERIARVATSVGR